MTDRHAIELILRLRRAVTSVRLTRTVVDTALVGLGVASTCRADLILAIGEACTNAVQHAAPSAGYEIHLHVLDSQCDVTVADHGPGFTPDLAPSVPPPGAASGRGLPLIAALTDRVHIDSHPARGTTIRITKRLTFAAAT